MHIKIALRLRPFSHKPGTCCLIPHTSWEAEIYPTKIFFRDLAGTSSKEIDLPLKGPVKGFTIVLDLEKECLEVLGTALQGYFHYYILSKENQLFLSFKNGEQQLLPFVPVHKQLVNKERLSLGVHKKQDWDIICRRKSMDEIFPFWLRLSQLIPKIDTPQKRWGNYLLMEKKVEKKEFVDHFSLLFQTAFQGILSPRIKDENYLGVLPEENIPEGISPIGLIHEGAQKIRALFFQEEGDELFILPELPPEFHSGRFVCIRTMFDDRIDLEWAKKQIKKICIFPKKTRLVQFRLQRKIQSFRLRRSLYEKGMRIERNEAFEVQENKPLYLDRFEH